MRPITPKTGNSCQFDAFLCGAIKRRPRIAPRAPRLQGDVADLDVLDGEAALAREHVDVLRPEVDERLVVDLVDLVVLGAFSDALRKA